MNNRHQEAGCLVKRAPVVMVKAFTDKDSKIKMDGTRTFPSCATAKVSQMSHQGGGIMSG